MWRAIVVTLAALAVMLSARAALVSTLRAGNSEAALSFGIKDGVALGAKADNLLVAALNMPNDRRLIQSAADIAKAALRQGALNAKALHVVAHSNDVSGNAKQTVAAFLAAQAVTRRDLLTQLWLIEYSVRKNDAKSALTHYDYALSTSVPAAPILLPTLKNALSDAEIQASFRPYIVRRPAWLPDFMRYFIDNSEDVDALARVIRSAGGLPKTHEYNKIQMSLMRRLVATDKVEAALTHYRLTDIIPHGQEMMTNFSPALTGDSGSPWAWNLLDEAGISSRFESASVHQSISLRVEVESGWRGIAARKLLALKSGVYQFHQSIETLAGKGSEAFWQLRCASSGGHEVIWTSGLVGKRIEQGPTIPANCASQMLELQTAGGIDGERLEMTVHVVDFREVSQGK